MNELKNWGPGLYVGKINFVTNICPTNKTTNMLFVGRSSRLVMVHVDSHGIVQIYQPKEIKSWLFGHYNGGRVGRQMRVADEKDAKCPLAYWDFIYSEFKKQKGRIVWECLSKDLGDKLFDAIRHGVQYNDIEPLKTLYGGKYESLSLSGFSTVNKGGKTCKFDINSNIPNFLSIVK